MITVVEHPDDVQARIDLRDSLLNRRHIAGLSGEAVSRLGGFGYGHAVRDLERKNSWELWRAQQWARALDLTLTLSIDLPVPDDDVTSMILRGTTAFGGFDEDRLHLQIVAADLVRTRVSLGVSAAEMCRRLGVDESSVRGWEKKPLHSWLRMFQRYARALGGSVHPVLRPADVAVSL